jgi:hypothetical protein
LFPWYCKLKIELGKVNPFSTSKSQIIPSIPITLNILGTKSIELEFHMIIFKKNIHERRKQYIKAFSSENNCTKAQQREAK